MRLFEFDEQNAPLTQQQLDSIERYAELLFQDVGIDVDFTRHFLDRVNNERNRKQITAKELTDLFRTEREKWGKAIAQSGPDQEAVMKDTNTNINIPFVLTWDRKNQELDLIAKTVMRKPNFKTPNKVYPV